MKISKKKHLEMVLEKVPRHPNPKVELEQYSTPAPIAADLLWNAGSLGDIGGRNVLDIGCGCGILAIGSSLMNSNFSMGVDVDGEDRDGRSRRRDFSPRCRCFRVQWGSDGIAMR